MVMTQTRTKTSAGASPARWSTFGIAGLCACSCLIVSCAPMAKEEVAFSDAPTTQPSITIVEAPGPWGNPRPMATMAGAGPSGKGTLLSSPTTKPSATPTAQAPMFGMPKPVVMSTPTETVVAPSNVPPAERKGRSTAIIGLYGELVATEPHAGVQLDGGVNLGQVTSVTDGACVDPCVDRTGQWLAFSSTMHRKTADIYIKPVSGKTTTQVTNDPADDVMPAFSPDSKSLAFASDRAGNWDIYVISVDGGPAIQITNDADHELHPTWSADGSMIAYCRFGSQSCRWEIWAVEVQRPGVRHFLEYGVFPEWCPDIASNKIVFQRAKQRGSFDYSIWTVDFVDGQAVAPTEVVSAANAALINPGWSPDGKRIVFVAVIDPDSIPGSRPKQSDLWLVNVDGSGRSNLTNGQFANFQPTWGGDGAVYFVSDRSGVDNIWSVAPTRWLDSAPHAPTNVASGAAAAAPEPSGRP